MADNPLNQALTKLNNTISTINNKVEQGKGKVKEYKQQLIQKLQELNNQIKALKNSGNLNIIPQLRQQLQESQSALAKKTDELQRTNAELEEKNRSLQEIQQKIQELTKEIQSKTEEINQLKQLNGQKDEQISQLTSQIEQLNGQISELNKKKTDAENNLLAAQNQINTFIEEIDKINKSLQAEIEKIDQISVELANVDEDEVSSNFEEIRKNITDIMGMINNPEGGPVVASGEDSSYNPTINDIKDLNVEDLIKLQGAQKDEVLQKYNNLPLDEKIVMLNTLSSQLFPPVRGKIEKILDEINTNPQDESNINNVKYALQQIINSNKTRGGKRNRKHKTMKIRHRKTKKILRNGHVLRGGYVYSASKKLDRSSSVMSGSITRSNKKKSRRSG